MRRALHDAADTIEPTAWPAREVLGRAARRRRNRRIAVALPAVGAVLAVAAVAAAVTRGPGTPPPAATAPAGPTAPASSLADWPEVRVVAPGRPVDLGGGRRMRLTPAERCVDWADGAGWDCRDESNDDGNEPQGTVGVQVYGYDTGTRYLLLYRGPATPARMGVTAGGRVWPARIVMLTGHPGWAAGYADIPSSAAPQPGLTQPTATVWDANGTVLASLAPPRP